MPLPWLDDQAARHQQAIDYEEMWASMHDNWARQAAFGLTNKGLGSEERQKLEQKRDQHLQGAAVCRAKAAGLRARGWKS